MKVFKLNQNIEVSYPISNKLCEEHRTKPMDMFNLFSAYNTFFFELLDFFCLNDVYFKFKIDHWIGAGIDTDVKRDLFWEELPKGNVGIYLGFPSETNSIILEEIKYYLSHELVHVLIFSYLSTYLNCAVQWLNKRFGRDHLPPG